MPSHEHWRWFVLEILDEERGLTWDEAFGWVDGDEAWKLDAAIAELQSEGRIIRTGRRGGYVLADRPELGS